MTEPAESEPAPPPNPEAGGSIPEVTDTRYVHRGKIINLRVDEIAFPGGRKATREVVEHPGAVVIIARDEEGRVALVRQHRYAIGRYLLELPAGGLDPGEEPVATAQRELREEVGLDAAHWRPLGHFFSTPGFSNEILHVFLAQGLSPAYAEPDEDEDITVEWCEVAALLRHPAKIEDAKSLAALLLLEAEGSGTACV